MSDILGQSVLGYEYKKSLALAIKRLEENKLKVSNSKYAIYVKNKDDYISVDICTKQGHLIETIKFENDQMLDDQLNGES